MCDFDEKFKSCQFYRSNELNFPQRTLYLIWSQALYFFTIQDTLKKSHIKFLQFLQSFFIVVSKFQGKEVKELVKVSF